MKLKRGLGAFYVIWPRNKLAYFTAARICMELLITHYEMHCKSILDWVAWLSKSILLACSHSVVETHQSL